MASNADIEMRWVNAWNEVDDIVQSRRDVPCLLPDWSIISVDECLEWLQNSVCEGYLVRVEEEWVGHRRGVVVHRWRSEA